MKKICQLTKQEFEVTEQELDLLKRMGLREPLFSPKARRIMGLALRNERNLYMRKCSATGEQILSIYHDGHPFPVYKYDYWIGEGWDAPSLDYDKSRSFLEQYAELSKLAPRPNLFAPYNQNCDYVNAAEKNKNCFMHILADRCEDCYYTHGTFACKDTIDSAHSYESELCYEVTDCRNCYHCRMCFLCDNSSELSFCFDCRGSQDCFFSQGLRNQKYCFFNEQLSKENYERKISEIALTSNKTFTQYKDRFLSEIMENADYTRMINTENSDGNFQINTKNCHKCYDIEECEDCMYLHIGANGLRDVQHSHAIVDGSELIVGNVSTTEAYNCHNVIGCWTTKDSCYSEFLQGCRNCMGCISLRHKKFCILNKQYSEEEYEELRTHIINELGEYWGSPFPIELATFDYQDSTYRDYGTLTKEEVETIGWRYGEPEVTPEGEFTATKEIPYDINDFNEEDLKKVYKCEATGKPFKIITQEYKLLKKIGVPLPCKHYEARFQERIKFRKKTSQEF